ncbi:sulfur carrier protein ThiS adenylyltransferase ThiF [candidate division WOR-3 bacterium]|nr:sulfur carrier protein ThiS adenylyltransferase ThiF [candidate division WOR-3 bacterium]
MRRPYGSLEKILRRRKVGIAGCGGLGSNCAVSLARAGIGGLLLVDFDFVTESNLDRQYYFINQVGKKKVEALQENILGVDPEVKVETFFGRIREDNVKELFGDCGLIVEALDVAQEKAFFIQKVSECFPRKPIVSGSGIAGYGSNNRIKTRRFGNLWVCGDGETEVSKQNPPLSPKVTAIANLQANQILEIILKNR